MIANVSAHRRANAFAQALDERQASQDRTPEQTCAPAAADEQDRLPAVAGRLARIPKPELDPDVRIVQRAQLVAAMEAMLSEGAGSDGPRVPEQRRRGAHRATSLSKLKPRSRWSQGLAAGGLTVGVAAGAFSGVAAASSDALPGDSLYGLKRGMEDLKRGMADDESDRGEIYLGQASTRMNEARRLMERGRSGDLDHESLGEVRRALSGMRHDASEGHRLLSAAYARDGSLAPIQALESFSTSNRRSWSELRDRLPVQLTDVGDGVTSVFDAIDDEVGPLKSLLPAAPGSSDPSRGRAGDSSGTGDAKASQDSTPSTSGSSSEPGASGGTTPRPSESQRLDERLIGGAGDLLDPPKGSASTLPGSSSGSAGGSAKPDITLPPLLPGLLPGLGIDGDDDR
ncbi:DUF5667 domain-containing protein [Streptomyces sp. NPDC048639]|uniref:DUF5667 domain-containing protein n=1 Tax=Streptomyces sp. NPDC048639 TaxID=3365581 RepID=UPI003719D442